MKTMTYTESRARYAEVLDAVIDNREEVVITRAGHEPVRKSASPHAVTTTENDRRPRLRPIAWAGPR